MNSQESLTDQLNQLVAVGNKAGLYDAVDFLKGHMEIARKRQERFDRREETAKRLNAERERADLRRLWRDFAPEVNTLASILGTTKEELVTKLKGYGLLKEGEHGL